MNSTSGAAPKIARLGGLVLALLAGASKAYAEDVSPPPPAFSAQAGCSTSPPPAGCKPATTSYPTPQAFATYVRGLPNGDGLLANPVYGYLAAQGGSVVQAMVVDGSLSGIRIRTHDGRTFLVSANKNGANGIALELKNRKDGKGADLVAVKLVGGKIVADPTALSKDQLAAIQSGIQRLQGLSLLEGKIVFDGAGSRPDAISVTATLTSASPVNKSPCAGGCGGVASSASQPGPPDGAKAVPESITPVQKASAKQGEHYLEWGKGSDGEEQHKLMVKAEDGKDDEHVGYVTTNDLLFYFGNADPDKFEVSRERASREWTLFGRQGAEVAVGMTSKKMAGYFDFAFDPNNVERAANGKWIRDLANEQAYRVSYDAEHAPIHAFQLVQRMSVLDMLEAPAFVGFNGARYVLDKSNNYVQYSPAPLPSSDVPNPTAGATTEKKPGASASAGGKENKSNHPILAAMGMFGSLASPVRTLADIVAQSVPGKDHALLTKAAPTTPSATATTPPTTNVPAKATTANPQLDAGLKLLSDVNPDGFGRAELWNKKVKSMPPPAAEQVAALEAAIQGTSDDAKRQQAIQLLGAFSFMPGAEPAARRAMAAFMLRQLGPASSLSPAGKKQLAEELDGLMGDYQAIARPGEDSARQIWDGLHGLAVAYPAADPSGVRETLAKYLGAAPAPPPSSTRPADDALRASLEIAGAYISTARRIEDTTGGGSREAKSVAALGNGNIPSPDQILALRALAQFGADPNDRAPAYHYLRLAAQLQGGQDPKAALSTVDFLLGLLNPVSQANAHDRKELIENLQQLAASTAETNPSVSNAVAVGFSNLLRAPWPGDSAEVLKALSSALLNADPQKYRETLFASARNKPEIASGLALLAADARFRRQEALLGYTPLLNGMLADQKTPVETAVSLIGAIQNLENSKGYYTNANLAALLANALDNPSPEVRNAAYQAMAASGRRIRSGVMPALLAHAGSETEPATVKAAVEALAAMIPPPTRTTYSGRGRNTPSRTFETFAIPDDSERSQALDALAQIALSGNPPEGAARAARLLGGVVQPTEIDRLKQLIFMASNPQFSQFAGVQAAARAALGDGSGGKSILNRLEGRSEDYWHYQYRKINIASQAGLSWTTQTATTPQAMKAAYEAFMASNQDTNWDVEPAQFKKK